MNFFAHQDKARSTTRKLVVLFTLAILTLIVMTSLLVMATFYATEFNTVSAEFGTTGRLLNFEIFLMISLGVIAVVGLGSVWRFMQLRGGGKNVAESLGGKLLNVSSLNADERKVLNVVEEMALAAGLPVPPVYVMEDAAINAFAAGYQPQDAVIGVTRGCIRLLSRDELQGVIAHEFSHIFNGDMRLNIRLMGLLYGIMVLGMIGYFIMRSSMYRSRGRNNKGGGIIILGIGLIAIGYGGTFFGNMIKAAVSRQREFLADASAVQFTRNPQGIGGALKKIGGYSTGSRIQNDGAQEISHMLFAQGLSAGLTGLFSTHPPLQDRIRKIEPNWSGQFPEVSYSAGKGGETAATPGASAFAGEHAAMPERGSASAETSAIDSVGQPGPEHINVAATQLAGIPEDIKAEAHSTFGASALMYALLMECAAENTASKQMKILEQALSKDNYGELQIICKKMHGFSRELVIPLVDIALPGLKQFSPTQYRTFMSYISQLMTADENISLFEWSLFKILRYNLGEHKYFKGRSLDIKKLREECEVLMSALAGAGHEYRQAAENSFNEARQLLSLRESGNINFNPEFINNTQALEKAVDKLKQLKPLQKPLLLKAMGKCIDADGKVTPEERELLRAISSLLDCPIPPLLAGQKFA